MCNVIVLVNCKQISTAENSLRFQGYIPVYRVTVYTIKDECTMYSTFMTIYVNHTNETDIHTQPTILLALVLNSMITYCPRFLIDDQIAIIRRNFDKTQKNLRFCI